MLYTFIKYFGLWIYLQKTEWLYNKLLISFQFLIQIFSVEEPKNWLEPFGTEEMAVRSGTLPKSSTRLSQQNRIAPHSLILLSQATFLYSHQMNWPSCSLAMSPITFPQPLPTSQSEWKDPSLIIVSLYRYSLSKTTPITWTPWADPRWGICSIPSIILRIKIRG